MCGISGYINFTDTVSQKTIIERMNQKITHRGPDDEGCFFNDHVNFGHRRLSILDLSSAGHQPMSFFGLTITYNGEIYNYLELKEELLNLGYQFNTQTDTEVILAAYSHWGKQCLHKFNGMWAFAIYDRKSNEVFCSRDRFGIKPFVYYSTTTYFAFASEIKQFEVLPGWSAKINYPVVYQYLANNRLNETEQTFFTGVYELRGGHSLTINLNNYKISVNKWYFLNVNHISNTYDEACTTFKYYFTDSLKLRMRSDVAVGSCLSGGLDSSSIVCGIHNAFPHAPITTVSTCFEDKKYDEQEFIDAVTEKTTYKAVKIFPDLNDLTETNLWDKLIYHQDQPIISFSHFSEYKVFEAAKNNELIVMLDGQGSDEYLAGYPEFGGLFLNQFKSKFSFLAYFRYLLSRAQLLELSPLLYIIRQLKKDVKKTFLRKHVKPLAEINPTFYKKYQYPDKTNNAGSLKDLSITELTQTSIPYQLHSEDRNSMLHSIESRLPFLDYRLVEFVLALPDNYKIRDARTKAILRDAMQGVLPDKIINRHDKKGFPASDESWFKNNPEKIEPILKEILLLYPSIFTPQLVTGYLQFVNGKGEYDNIWLKAISFHKWRIIFNAV